jgi:hypothetical protein
MTCFANWKVGTNGDDDTLIAVQTWDPVVWKGTKYSCGTFKVGSCRETPPVFVTLKCIDFNQSRSWLSILPSSSHNVCTPSLSVTMVLLTLWPKGRGIQSGIFATYMPSRSGGS